MKENFIILLLSSEAIEPYLSAKKSVEANKQIKS